MVDSEVNKASAVTMVDQEAVSEGQEVTMVMDREDIMAAVREVVGLGECAGRWSIQQESFAGRKASRGKPVSNFIYRSWKDPTQDGRRSVLYRPVSLRGGPQPQYPETLRA